MKKTYIFIMLVILLVILSLMRNKPISKEFFSQKSGVVSQYGYKYINNKTAPCKVMSKDDCQIMELNKMTFSKEDIEAMELNFNDLKNGIIVNLGQGDYLIKDTNDYKKQFTKTIQGIKTQDLKIEIINDAKKPYIKVRGMLIIPQGIDTTNTDIQIDFYRKNDISYSKTIDSVRAPFIYTKKPVYELNENISISSSVVDMNYVLTLVYR